MRYVKIAALSLIVGILAYAIYTFIMNKNEFSSPIPDDGINVIYITPAR